MKSVNFIIVIAISFFRFLVPVFCSYYCFNGLLRERQFELVGYAIGMAVILLSIIINYCMEGREDDYTKLVSYRIVP